jgi:polyhydroxyalkanoate synthesis regulator phasin
VTLFVYQIAEAEEQGAGVNARQHNQMERIRQGIASGELTREEARRLLQEQRAIRREETAYQSDGVLGRAERADLHRDLNRSSAGIARQRHDRQRVAFDGVPADAGIDARQARQREAIRRGIASGEITPREAERLWREQARIERYETRAEADGRISRAERVRLDRQLDNAGRHIRHESHDRQAVLRHGSRHDRADHRGHDRARHFGHDWGRHRGQQVAHRGGGNHRR